VGERRESGRGERGRGGLLVMTNLAGSNPILGKAAISAGTIRRLYFIKSDFPSGSYEKKLLVSIFYLLNN
jgi:hypothetical protein